MSIHLSDNIAFCDAATFLQEPRAKRYLRMLAILPAPITTQNPQIDLLGEWEQMRRAISSVQDPVSGRGAQWAVVRLFPPTLLRLRDALIPSESAYQVVHFCGHGTPEGLWLEDDFGCEQFVTVDEVVAAFKGMIIASPTRVRLVVLSVCHGETLARALVDRAGVSCAIATRDTLDDREAQLFGERLYRRLADGETIAASFSEAQRTIVEKVQKTELRILGTPEERAANLLIFGNGNFRLEIEDGPDQEPLFVPYPVPHNHPLPFEHIAGFVGRNEERLRLARWLREPGESVLAITGVGGYGKTALALIASLRHSHSFDALVYVSASGIPGFGSRQILRALSMALSRPIASEEERDPLGAVARRLVNHRVLLVLDNLESLERPQDLEIVHLLESVDFSQGSKYFSRINLTPRA